MKYLKSSIMWINRFLSDEPNSPSSKRILGTLCVLTLCFTLIYGIFSKSISTPSDALVNTIGLLAFGLLGLTSVDKYNMLRKKISKKDEENSHSDHYSDQ